MCARLETIILRTDYHLRYLPPYLLYYPLISAEFQSSSRLPTRTLPAVDWTL